MNKFVMWYAYYDPDNYMGHRKVNLKSTNRADAEKEGRELLDKSFHKGPWEMWIFEVAWDSGPMLHPKQ